jgi:hypothetical protein
MKLAGKGKGGKCDFSNPPWGLILEHPACKTRPRRKQRVSYCMTVIEYDCKIDIQHDGETVIA